MPAGWVGVDEASGIQLYQVLPNEALGTVVVVLCNRLVQITPEALLVYQSRPAYNLSLIHI